MAILQTRHLIASGLFSPSVCEAVFANPSLMTFDATALPQKLTFDSTRSIYASHDGGHAGEVVVRVGLAPATNVPRVKIQSIDLTISSGGAGTYIGTWTFAFDPQPLVQAMAPIQISTNLSVDDATPSAAVIRNCVSLDTPRTLDVQTITSTQQSCGGSQTYCPALSEYIEAPCPTGYAVTGCGYIGSWNPTANDPNWDFHANAPDGSWIDDNGCHLHAGGNPGCGVCFRVQSICVRAR